LGRRVKKAVYAYGSGAWELQKEILFVYDGWNLIQEKEVSGTGDPLFDKFYVWGLDLSQSLQGAGGIGGLVCRVSGGEVRHYFYDANGNVGQLVNPADGAVTARYEYDPFGKAVFVDGADAVGNAFRFSSKFHDDETNLDYYSFRYYSAELGRWTNRDPLLENGGANIYSFVQNDSLNLIDPFGQQSYNVPFQEYVPPITYGGNLDQGYFMMTGVYVQEDQYEINIEANCEAKYAGWEIHAFLGGGRTHVKCCDGEFKRNLHYTKICFGAAAEISLAAGIVYNANGESCKNPPENTLGGELGFGFPWVFGGEIGAAVDMAGIAGLSPSVGGGIGRDRSWPWD